MGATLSAILLSLPEADVEGDLDVMGRRNPARLLGLEP